MSFSVIPKINESQIRRVKMFFFLFFLTILIKHLSVKISDAHLISLFEHFVDRSKLCYNAVQSASD